MTLGFSLCFGEESDIIKKLSSDRDFLCLLKEANYA